MKEPADTIWTKKIDGVRRTSDFLNAGNLVRPDAIVSAKAKFSTIFFHPKTTIK